MKKYAFLFIFSFFCIAKTFSQNSLLDFYFENKEIPIEQGQTFTNFLIIKNTGKDSVSITKLLPVMKYPGLLLTADSDFLLAGNETVRLPVKFLATIELLKRKDDQIKFGLVYKTKESSEPLIASFTITKKEEKNVSIFPGPQQQYFDPKMGEKNISVLVENQGYHQRTIRFTCTSVPAGLEIYQKEIVVLLDAKERKMIEIKASINNSRNFYPDYRLEIKAQDAELQETVGSSTIQLIALSNNRQIVPTGSLSNQNAVEIAYNQMDRQLHNVLIKGNAEFNAGKQMNGKLNAAADYYFDQNIINVFDTWLELEKNNYQVRLGNLYAQDYDYSIGGRGAKVNMEGIRRGQLEVLAVQSSYNLYSNSFTETHGSEIVAAKYLFQRNKMSASKVSYLFDRNVRAGTGTHLLHAVSPFIIDSIHHFRLEGGFSTEEGLKNSEAKPGSNLLLDYQAQIKKWDLHSRNSLSSSYYAGQTRGAVVFNQFIGYRIANRKRLLLNYDYSTVQPRYLEIRKPVDPGNPVFSSLYRYRQQSFKAGYEFRFHYSNILVSPQIIDQFYLENGLGNNFLSYRLQTTGSTTIGSHAFNLSLEYSHSKSSLKNEWFSGFKSNFSYRINGLHVNAAYQYNPNDVTDFRHYDPLQKDFNNYSLNTTYSFSSPKNQMMGSISAGINYSELYRNINQNLNGYMEYKLSSYWSATAHGNYTHYRTKGVYQYLGGNTRLKVGVKRYFERRTERGNCKISLQLFNDRNGNGKLEEGEEFLANEQVQIGGYLAITNQNGKVWFQNVPKGLYDVKVGEQNFQFKEDISILVNSNKNLKLGIKKFTKISGRLKEIRQDYDEQNSNVAGIVVYARDSEGSVVSTLIDQNNQFDFFLKKGVYQVFIENDRYEYTRSSTSILVDDRQREEIVFEFRKKNRQIKIKRF